MLEEREMSSDDVFQERNQLSCLSDLKLHEDLLPSCADEEVEEICH